MIHMMIACAAILYGGWRGWSTWPAVDRHDDRRGEQLMTRLTLGISDPDAVLVSQMNWELENVLLYLGRHRRPDLTWTRLGDVLPHFPFRRGGPARDLPRHRPDRRRSGAGRRHIRSPLSCCPDDAVPALSLACRGCPDPARRTVRAGAADAAARRTPRRSGPRCGARDRSTGGNVPARTPRAFELIAGIRGEPPNVSRSADRPFRMSFGLEDEPFTVRMDSWLPFDTFRRPASATSCAAGSTSRSSSGA